MTLLIGQYRIGVSYHRSSVRLLLRGAGVVQRAVFTSDEATAAIRYSWMRTTPTASNH